jgi:hypothetical protein
MSFQAAGAALAEALAVVVVSLDGAADADGAALVVGSVVVVVAVVVVAGGAGGVCGPPHAAIHGTMPTASKKERFMESPRWVINRTALNAW